MLRAVVITLLTLGAFFTPANAGNYPCSKSKGGVDHCQGSKFVCRDGSVSASKRKCTPSLAEQLRRKWGADNGVTPEALESPVEPAEPTSSEDGDQGFNNSPAGSPGPFFLASSGVVAVAADVRVIDGDTIQFGGQTFRLEGIDAPEMKQQCLDQSLRQYACGRRAKEALSAMMKAPVVCDVSGTDRYGRSLAYCRSGTVDVNRQMVASGWALAFVKYNDRYVSAEAEARSAKLGVWAAQNVQPPWEWRAAQQEALAPTGTCVIKGNISHGRKTYYMPFHMMYARLKVDEFSGEKWFCTEADAAAAGWSRAAR
jgi:endonuclease YncB( thermonuclease family)